MNIKTGLISIMAFFAMTIAFTSCDKNDEPISNTAIDFPQSKVAPGGDTVIFVAKGLFNDKTIHCDEDIHVNCTEFEVIGIKPDLAAPIMQLRSLVGKPASKVGAYFSSSNTWSHWMPSLEGSTLLLELQSGKYIIQEVNSSDVDAFVAVSDNSTNTLLHAFCFDLK